MGQGSQELVVPASPGVGAANTNIQNLNSDKKIYVGGDWSGLMVIEAGAFAGGGPSGFVPVLTVTRSNDYTVRLPAQYMRVRLVNTVSGTPTVHVVADDGTALVNDLDIPGPDAVGASVDVSASSSRVAAFVFGTFTGAVTIEGSGNDTSFFPAFQTFTAPGVRYASIPATELRVRRGPGSGTPQITVCAMDLPDTGGIIEVE